MNADLREIIIDAGPTSSAGVYKGYDGEIRPFTFYLSEPDIEIYLTRDQAKDILRDLIALLPDKAREGLEEAW